MICLEITFFFSFCLMYVYVCISSFFKSALRKERPSLPAAFHHPQKRFIQHGSRWGRCLCTSIFQGDFLWRSRRRWDQLMVPFISYLTHPLTLLLHLMCEKPFKRRTAQTSARAISRASFWPFSFHHLLLRHTAAGWVISIQSRWGGGERHYTRTRPFPPETRSYFYSRSLPVTLPH